MANLLNKRFTKTLIEEMARTIANSMHSQTIEQLRTEAKLVADALCKDIYAEHLKLIESLPKGFLSEISGTYINLVDGKGDYVDATQSRYSARDSRNHKRNRQYKETYSSSNLHIDFSKPTHLLYVHTNGGIKVNAKNPLVLASLECQENIVNAQVEREETIDQMQAMLAQFGSFTALYESWPAVREVVADFEPHPTTPHSKALPPATVFDDLNKKLGIPSKKVMTVSA